MFPEDSTTPGSGFHKNAPVMVSVEVRDQVTLWENASSLTILWFVFTSFALLSSLSSCLPSPLSLSTFSLEIHGSVHPNCIKSK